jgi:protein gp37
MAQQSAIEWTDATVNFWWGCTKVGPGCDHCYAETLGEALPAVASHWGHRRAAPEDRGRREADPPPRQWLCGFRR